jgi:hypothetical protein
MTEIFMDFLQGLLSHMKPFPNDNSVIIIDNAHIHQDPWALELIEQRYMTM